MEPIAKEAIAIIQLIDAIKLFNRKRFISAITLSGAAEEILAQLLKKAAKNRGLPLLTAEETEQFLFDSYPKLVTGKNYHIQRSKIRNELKHHGDKRNTDSVLGDFELSALTHIAGAMINYKMAHGEMPLTKVISDFCIKHGIS